METTRQFIYKHQAKLIWKQVKHGFGVLIMTEERESATEHKAPRHRSHHTKEGFLEIPLTR